LRTPRRSDRSALLDRAVDGGILFFAPTYVRRIYAGGGRLGPRRRPERWIGSTTPTLNPFSRPGEGQSHLAIPGQTGLTLRDALERRGDLILGGEYTAAYGATFPVLVKILDPGEPITFHFHAADADVRRHPGRFPGQHWGKDEAYYFLPGPPGPVPYTHVGLRPGVTRRELAAAIARGGALELSPAFYQRAGEGFSVPAGIPHRPGTALTLEVQQPSDVYTILEQPRGRPPLPPAARHPGFASVHDALGLIDYAASSDPRLLERNRLVPEPVSETRSRGGEEVWIFPPRLHKFSGKRLIVRTRFESVEHGPYVLFVWKGRGRVMGRRLRPGAEALVTADAARRTHLFVADAAPLEVFKFFPPAPRENR
jgi:hypothetical protein